MKGHYMSAQWKMWKTQMEQAESFDGSMEMFTEILQFCRCTDYASHLSKYLMYGAEAYTPSVTDIFAVDGFENIDTTDVDAVARRAATMTQAEQVHLFFGGAISNMCNGMRSYLEQVVAWE